MNETIDVKINNSSSHNEKNSKGIGLMTVGVLGFGAISISLISFSFIQPAFRKICLPFVPATDNQVSNVLKFLKQRKGKVLDLGSGDGRIVIESAKQLGLQSEGVELNPWLILYSKLNSYKSGVSSLTKFHRKDLFKVNLNDYNNVVIFGVDEMMLQIEQKAAKELNNDSCMIVCRFPLPNWKPTAVHDEGIDSVWVYEKSKNI